MKSTESQQTIQRYLKTLYQEVPLIGSLIEALHQEKAHPFLVGGAVRDLILRRPVGDLDIEVFGCSLELLEKILSRFGHVRLVGKAYGVLRIDGLDSDFSVPRIDAQGRKPLVILDEDLSLIDACRRRDLTMNAMAIDLLSQELHDPFNGLQAIAEKRLTAPDPERFVEDPLRFYRVMQFAARFAMEPDATLSVLCKTMDLSQLSSERIAAEYEKLFLYGQKPSIAFRWLAKIDRLTELLPELGATIGCQQRPDYHPEGDVFEHTMQAIDGAAVAQYESEEKRLIIILAALCHDLGKVVATKMIDGVLKSNGHALAGVALAEQLLDRLMVKQSFKKPITRLVRYHMDPIAFVKNNAQAGAYKRLARNLAPELTLTDLHTLSCFDKSARNPLGDTPLQECSEPLLELFLENARKYHVADGQEPPLLTGADLLDEVPAGPPLGLLLRRAYEIQIEEGITDKNELKKRVMKR